MFIWDYWRLEHIPVHDGQDAGSNLDRLPSVAAHEDGHRLAGLFSQLQGKTDLNQSDGSREGKQTKQFSIH